jgi:predicted aspartyl protease
MPSYDAIRFDPPAPVASVAIRNPQTGANVSDVSLLIDTGADITLLPRNAVERAGIATLAGVRYELVGFDGGRSSASAVTADMVFLNRAYRGRYVLTDQDIGVLGRDVLNHAVTVLDGPRQQWSQASQ